MHGSVPSGVGLLGYGEGSPLSSRLGDLGERLELPAGSGPEHRPKMDLGVF